MARSVSDLKKCNISPLRIAKLERAAGGTPAPALPREAVT